MRVPAIPERMTWERLYGKALARPYNAVIELTPTQWVQLLADTDAPRYLAMNEQLWAYVKAGRFPLFGRIIECRRANRP